MALPQSYSLMVDAPDPTGVPPMGLHPHVPIVMDAAPLHKRTQYIYRQFTGHVPHKNFRHSQFVTMEGVWKRVAVRHGVRYGREFFKHIVPAVLKPARTLWNQLIGFLFLSFGAIFGVKTVRYGMDYMKAPPSGGTGELIRLAMAGFCAFVMLWYGVSSFLRARRISRS